MRTDGVFQTRKSRRSGACEPGTPVASRAPPARWTVRFSSFYPQEAGRRREDRRAQSATAQPRVTKTRSCIEPVA
jgi:hypothetical protein